MFRVCASGQTNWSRYVWRYVTLCLIHVHVLGWVKHSDYTLLISFNNHNLHPLSDISIWAVSIRDDLRASSWAVVSARASPSQLLDRHRAVKGVKLLHWAHPLSVKSPHSAGEGSAQGFQSCGWTILVSFRAQLDFNWIKSQPVTFLDISLD